MRQRISISLLILGALFCLIACETSQRFEQRNEVAPLRPLNKRYNSSFFYRHNDPYRFSASIHFAHAKQHDILQNTPAAQAAYYDQATEAEFLKSVFNPPWSEPHMMYYGPYIGQAMWKLYRAIDWTHIHHEETYDIMAAKNITWQDKAYWTNEAVWFYLTRNRDVARSCAPLDITMRRAAVMMKPYATHFRNKYPQSNNFFFMAHWWHPVIYEAQMIAGNDTEQEQAVRATHDLMPYVAQNPPKRMLLSREGMPRYSRMSPESGNIFDNLHMLHGISYDILAYEGWTLEEKRKEMYRVIDAMSYKPGDERYARKFTIPHPEMDPRVYSEWMTGYEGSMNQIMEEMLHEMMPHMSPDGKHEVSEKVMQQFRLKLTPGMQEGEIEGSIHDALMKLMPNMKMDQEGMKPGNTPTMMVNAMLKGWEQKYGSLPDVEPIDMSTDPTLPPIPQDQGVTASETQFAFRQ